MNGNVKMYVVYDKEDLEFVGAFITKESMIDALENNGYLDRDDMDAVNDELDIVEVNDCYKLISRTLVRKGYDLE